MRSNKVAIAFELRRKPKTSHVYTSMPLLCRVSMLLRQGQHPFASALGSGEESKQQAQIFQELRLMAFHQKEIISSCQTKCRAQTSLAIQGISCQNFADPIDVLNEARSQGQFTLLFLCFVVLLLLFLGGLALRFTVCWLILGLDIVFLHLSLAPHHPALMVDSTHGMDGRAMLFFKLPSPFLDFSINRHRTFPSLPLFAGQKSAKDLAKRAFHLFHAHSAKEALDRRLMGGYSLLQAQRLFELVTRVLLPIGLWPVLRESWIGFSLELHLSRDEAFCLLSFGFVRTHKP